jgi:hypothetical protein
MRILPVFLLLLLTGCVAAEPEPFAGKVIDCEHQIAAIAEPDPRLGLVLGAVALPQEIIEAHPSGEPGLLFAKTGLVVRSGVTVDLSVDDSGGDRIDWGNAGEPGNAVRVPACVSDKPWLVFAGGYTVPGPHCVLLTVRVDGDESAARVPVGAAC